MQALFSFYGSALSPDAAVFVEADGARVALVASVAILNLSIASGDGVWGAEDAFDVVAAHARPDLLTDHRIAPDATGDAVAAPIVRFAHDGQGLGTRFSGALASRVRLGQGNGFA